jgi:hypothetical protein
MNIHLENGLIIPNHDPSRHVLMLRISGLVVARLAQGFSKMILKYVDLKINKKILKMTKNSDSFTANKFIYPFT